MSDGTKNNLRLWVIQLCNKIYNSLLVTHHSNYDSIKTMIYLKRYLYLGVYIGSKNDKSDAACDVATLILKL